jgi:hypothetical protein
MRSVIVSAAVMSMTGLALAQTQRTSPSAYATLPTMSSAFPTAPDSPCLSFGRPGVRYDARGRRWSAFNPTSPCYSGTPYPSYSALEPGEPVGPRPRPKLPGAASLNESEANARIEAKGYVNVSGLMQDGRGIWRGQAMMRDGKTVDVILDLEGNVYSELSTPRIRIERAPLYR